MGPWSAAATRAQQRLLAHIEAQPKLYPLRSLAPLWRVLPTGDDAAPEVHALQDAVTRALRKALARPEPADDDLSLDALEIEWVCRCADCLPVIHWASDRQAERLTLPMAEARRAHVQAQLLTVAAPINTQIVKQGSPHKLVLGKRAELGALRRTQRLAWAEALARFERGATSKQ